MVRRFVILFAVVLFSHQVVWCQSGKQLNLPQGLSPEYYQPGKVWVKLRASARDALQGAGTQGRIAMGNIDIHQIMPLLSQKSYQKNLGRVAPRKQHVDISLYYGITFSDSRALEEVMQELYATGYFEVIEPVYNAEPQLVVDDPDHDQQYYLDLIRAEEAWDITTGDPSIVIGIVDTGGDLNHPDLQDKLYIDPAEPIDGVDNDGDGFIDNDRGWDFSGDDESLIGTPGFVGDNDPSINTGGVFTHGTMVAGCAAASTNNSIGVAGIGYNAKLLFTKHFADNQPTSGTNYSSNLYEGVLYVATHGAKIINCSWGSYNRSTIAQDIINYVTLDLGCLVIAAAGNSNLETPIYPAGYQNVLSVASSDAADGRSMFSNYGETVDIIAPGSNIYTTTYDDGYGTDSGTSLSAPLVSGAAALVWTQNPTFTPLQVAEQLRVSADDIIYDNSPSYAFKLGKGRLDVYQALTVQSPSIRASNQQFVKDNGGVPESGESGHLYFDFTNYLQPTSGLTVTLTSASPFISITTGQIALGGIAENSTIRNTTMPFEVTLSPTFPIDQPVDALLTFTDGAYEGFQLVHFILPSYVDIDENNIITSLTPSGRIGFGNTPDQSAGSGFIFDQESLLFEMGLVMGSSSMSIYSNVRGMNGEFDADFFPAAKLVKSTPGERSSSEVTGAMRNDADSASATLSIEYQSMVWANDPYQNFVILEYKIKNTTMNQVTDFYFGIFADWDIASAGAGDRADWVGETNLGYVYPAQSSLLPRSGIQALSGNAQYYAIDNDPNVAGNPFGLYDGFTDDEKFQSISSGVSKTQAGTALNGGDVSHAVASGPFMIDAGEQITVAFALHAAGSDEELFTSAKYADSVYNYTLLAPTPIVDTADVCIGNSVSLVASGPQTFNWYRDFTGGPPIFSGPTFELPNLTNDTAFFVANAEESYESLRTRAQVIVHQTPEIIILGGLEICEGGLIELSVGTADEYLWSSGETTQDVSIGSSGQYTVAATYGSAICESNSVDVVIHPKPNAEFLTSTNVLHRDELISFTSDDENITSWLWDFGDGGISLDQNPEYMFTEEGDYTVTLAVTSDEGCHNSSSKMFGIITGIEDVNGRSVKAYPNPVAANAVYLEGPENATIELELLSTEGQTIRKSTMTGGTTLDVSNVVNGIYILKIVTSRDVITRKLIISR